MSEIDELPTERECLQNDDRLNDLVFLVDITPHLNSLNARLQGKDKLFTNLCDDISAFKMKLHLFIRQLTETAPVYQTADIRDFRDVSNSEDTCGGKEI